MEEHRKQLKLDDLNIVDIESEDSMSIIPRLKHSLEIIPQKPAIYPIDQIKKLIENRYPK